MDKVKFNTAGTDYYVYDLDASGYNRDKVDVRALLREELLDATKRYTDVVVISHGYSTKREKDGSVSLANRVVPSMVKRCPEGRRALYIQIKWPSFVTTLFEGEDAAPRELLKMLFEMLRDVVLDGDSKFIRSARSFGINSSNPEKAVNALENHALNFVSEAAPRDAAKMSVEELPDDVAQGIADLANELREQGRGMNGSTACLLDKNTDDGHNCEAAAVKKRFQMIKDMNLEPLVEPSKKTPAKKTDADENVDPRAFSVIGTVMTIKKTWDLIYTLFDVIFGTFERRAATVGSRGVHSLIAYLMGHTRKDVRFHCFGHSLGAHVVQSAAIGEEPGSKLPRKIHSLLLAQGACAADSVARGGAYRPLCTNLKPVAGPILATCMKMDRALKLYDFFQPKPLGMVGFEDVESKKVEVEAGIMQSETFRKHKLYSLAAKSVVSEHNDVADEELMNLFWQAACIEMKEEDYEVTDVGDLPKKYWKDYDVRTDMKTGGGGCSMF